MQNDNVKYKIISLFSIFYLLFVVGANAQQFDREVRPNTSFNIDFVLRTQGKHINAIEGDIRYDTNALTFLGIDDTRSTISIWVEKFKENKGVIHYSGIIPGGYEGEHVIVGVLRFMTKKEGVTTLNFENTKEFLHDGVGTEVALSSSLFVIFVTKEASQEIVESKPRDVFSPDPFSIQVSRDSTMFEGKWFIVFLAQDKDSGIDYYEVAEKRGFPGKAPMEGTLSWEKAESPYVLRDQSRLSHVYVRAVDKAGNITVSKLSPEPTITVEQYAVSVVIFIIITLLCIMIVWWEKRRKKEETML